jgi:hypothetical protein
MTIDDQFKKAEKKYYPVDSVLYGFPQPAPLRWSIIYIFPKGKVKNKKNLME